MRSIFRQPAFYAALGLSSLAAHAVNAAGQNQAPRFGAPAVTPEVCVFHQTNMTYTGPIQSIIVQDDQSVQVSVDYRMVEFTKDADGDFIIDVPATDPVARTAYEKQPLSREQVQSIQNTCVGLMKASVQS